MEFHKVSTIESVKCKILKKSMFDRESSTISLPNFISRIISLDDRYIDRLSRL